MTETQLLLLRLLRVAMGKEKGGQPLSEYNQTALLERAGRQGVTPIICDGLQQLYGQDMILKNVKETRN